jgi:hypothetical protein
MNKSFERLNLITYPPGAAGTFLTRLFALSEQTQFLWIQGTCDCRPKDHSIAEKLKYYWYFPEKISNWLRDAHLTPSGPHLCHAQYDYWETNPIIISCMHYSHMHVIIPDSPGSLNGIKKNTIQKIFMVKISDNLFSRLCNNVKLNHLQNKDADSILIEKIKANLDYDYIDMDLLVSPDTFLQEYTRVCESMGLVPIDDDLAISFIDNWKTFRLK